MRFWPLLFVVAGVAVAIPLTINERNRGDAKLAKVRDRAVEATVAQVQETLDRRMKALANEAGLLSNNEQLRLGVATDAQTVQNQIAEEGLHSLREHDVYAIGRIDPAKPGSLEMFVTHGFEQVATDAIEVSSAVTSVLKSPNATPASGMITLPIGVALVAAAPVTSHDQIFRGYLVIGDRLARASLTPLATETKSELLLSDGTRSLGYAGAPDGEVSLTAGIGKESQYAKETLTDPTGSSAGRAIELTPHTYLWIETSVANEAETIAGSVKLNVTLTWLLSVGISLATAIGFMLRGRKAPPPTVSAASDWAGATGMTPASPATLPPGMPIQSGGFSAPGVTTVPMRSGEPTPQPTGTTDPSMFGRYRLLDRLGSGGMAEVWTAVVYGAEGFRRPFVVKRIRRDMAGNSDLMQSFIDEANLQSQLVHSNVVPVLDFGNLNGEYYMAQEYILGRDLGVIATTLAERGRRLDPSIATYILAETLKALDYAHTLTDKTGKALGIVHRDISPNNILCSTRGEVKLIDFGIAKSVSKVGQTEVGTVKGNLRFMSPEQAQGLLVDARSDLFSLGMSLYFTQTGSSMYSASQPYDLLMLAAKGPQPTDLAKIEALPPPLGWVLGEALAPNVADRYASAQAFLEAVQPQAPADGARRLAAMLKELFGEDLRKQEQRFADAVAGAESADATVQRPGLSLKSGT